MIELMKSVILYKELPNKVLNAQTFVHVKNIKHIFKLFQFFWKFSPAFQVDDF